MKYIISGGGTGGHIFPAIAIGKALKKIDPEAELLFVGAENRMEMERVPKAGFNIVGLPVAGFNRKNPFKNIPVVFKLFKSLYRSRKIIRDFMPDIAIGVGGYASGPILKEAQRRHIPTVLQEQNSYAGVTNKMLAKRADAICVAYNGMDKFFPKDRIRLTGNPLRESISKVKEIGKEDAKGALGFNPNKKLLAIIGGSLGALTINESISDGIQKLLNSGCSILWQTGKRYYETYKHLVNESNKERLHIVPFIENIDIVYAAADLLISRAGATTISEIQCLGLPAILVPSPNVAEDHQRKNAEALSTRNAAITILDKYAMDKLVSQAIGLLNDESRLQELSDNVREMRIVGSDETIARIIVEIAKQK